MSRNTTGGSTPGGAVGSFASPSPAAGGGGALLGASIEPSRSSGHDDDAQPMLPAPAGGSGMGTGTGTPDGGASRKLGDRDAGMGLGAGLGLGFGMGARPASTTAGTTPNAGTASNSRGSAFKRSPTGTVTTGNTRRLGGGSMGLMPPGMGAGLGLGLGTGMGGQPTRTSEEENSRSRSEAEGPVGASPARSPGGGGGGRAVPDADDDEDPDADADADELEDEKRERRERTVIDESLKRDQVVGWGVFPMCHINFDVVQGKYKAPILRGELDRALDKYAGIEQRMADNLDCWLGNLYFDVKHWPRQQEDYDVQLKYNTSIMDPDTGMLKGGA
jgi:hypothetical protein